MDIETKYKLIEKIMQTENDTLLYQVKEILEAEDKDWWTEISPELKASIEQGIKESDEGKGRPHEEVMAAMRKKFNL